MTEGNKKPEGEKGHKKTPSGATGVMNINDLEKDGIEIKVHPDTQKTGWKINTSPTTVEETSILKQMLTTPPVKKIDLHFTTGMDLTARNLKGVTIKDALDTIFKANKKRADDELDNPYLAGFEWDKEESWTRLVVHLQKEAGGSMQKKKKKGGD